MALWSKLHESEQAPRSSCYAMHQLIMNKLHIRGVATVKVGVYIVLNVLYKQTPPISRSEYSSDRYSPQKPHPKKSLVNPKTKRLVVTSKVFDRPPLIRSIHQQKEVKHASRKTFQCRQTPRSAHHQALPRPET